MVFPLLPRRTGHDTQRNTIIYGRPHFFVACGAIHRLFFDGNGDYPGESIVRTLSHGVGIFLQNARTNTHAYRDSKDRQPERQSNIDRN